MPSHGTTTITEFLAGAGITINGSQAWDIQVHDDRFFGAVSFQGSLGLGDAYLAGWWDCSALDQFFHRVLIGGPYRANAGLFSILRSIKETLWERQSKSQSTRVAKRHYDLPIRLFELMLDSRMQYTCAYWHEADSLEEAQLAKMELICRKLDLKPGMKILELGGGFGGLAAHLARRHGCEVVSYNISASQVERARLICAGLPVEIVQADYREATGAFDRVVSVGLCEHIGPGSYRRFARLVEARLRSNGLFLLHTIGSPGGFSNPDPWLRKHIFPGGITPTAAQLSCACNGLLAIEDWHNIGTDYDPTLMAWHGNFTSGWPEIKDLMDASFYRKWTYYLLCCAGSFRARHAHLWQILLSKERITPVKLPR